MSIEGNVAPLSQLHFMEYISELTRGMISQRYDEIAL